MIFRFLKKWSYYIVSSFIVLLIVFIVLYPTIIGMSAETRDKADYDAVSIFFLEKRKEIQDKIIRNEPISSLEEAPNWNKVEYFYRSTEGAMYIQTDKRAYFLIPIKDGDEIKWKCQSSDGSITLTGCI